MKIDADGFRVFDLGEIMKAAERAEKVVASWPEWKRRLAASYPVRDFRREDP